MEEKILKNQPAVLNGQIWLISVFLDHGKSVKNYTFSGSREEAKEVLFSMIEEDRKTSGGNWKQGSETVEEIEGNDGFLYGYACFEDCELDYQAIWLDSLQNIRQVKKEEPQDYVIAVCRSDREGVDFSRFSGSREEAKQELLAMISRDREADPYFWDHGCESTDDITEMADGRLCGYASYDGYHTEYTAAVIKNI